MAKLFDKYDVCYEASDSNVKALFMSAPIPILVMEGREGRYTFANDMASKIYGPREFLGKTMREAFPDFDVQIYQLVENVFDAGISVYGNYYPVQADWDSNSRPFKRYFNFAYAPFRNSEGNIIGVVSMANEVTEQVNLLKKTREMQNMWDAISKVSPITHWVTDKNNRTIYTTDAWMKWTGTFLEDNKGEGWQNYIFEEDRVGFIKKFTIAAASRQNFEGEFRIKRADGAIRICYTRSQPWYDEKGEYCGYTGFTVDITDCKPGGGWHISDFLN
jgi:PAS domain S-box-containing protein